MEQDPNRQSPHPQQASDDPFQVAWTVLGLLEIARQDQHFHHFRQFRRLDEEARDLEPARRAELRLGADVDHDKQDHHHDIHRDIERGPITVVNRRDQHDHHQPHQSKVDLPANRIDDLLVPRDRRADHRHAKGDGKDDHAQQPEIKMTPGKSAKHLSTAAARNAPEGDIRHQSLRAAVALQPDANLVGFDIHVT